MYKNKFDLRKVAMIIACLAGMMMFASCEKSDDGDEPSGEIGLSDDAYYGLQQNDLEKVLRNVHFKYWYQIPDVDPPKNEKMYGEVLSCKGRLWAKGVRWQYWDNPVEKWYGYDKSKYWAYSFNLHEKIEWLGFMGFTPPFETMHDGIIGGDAQSAIAQYFLYSKMSIWNLGVITETPVTGYVVTTTLTKYDEITVIAGRQCKSFSVHEKIVMYGNVVNDSEFVRVWYDPETKVTMRAEGHIDRSGFPTKFEITEIEYGKVTTAQIDKILENHPQYPNYKDISAEQEAGSGW